MDIRTISSHNFIPIIDPAHLRQSPDEFLAENGGFLSEVAVIAKSASGFVHYRSSTAPTDRTTNEFFKTFSSIADSIGIKVYAIINALADSFLAKNPSYSAVKEGGNKNEDFVDPFKSSYTNYLKSITTEVMAFPVQGIVFDNVRFPHEEYSFCEACCRRFSEENGIERIFSLTDIHRDSRLLANWNKWRSQRLESILKEVTSTISTTKRNIDMAVTLDIDPAIDGAKGASRHYAQNIDVFGNYGTPTIHLSPWSPLPTSIDNIEYQKLVKNLDFAKEYQTKRQAPLNLLLWGIENESILPVIDNIKEVLPIKDLFIQNHFPVDFQKRREIHLGLS
ncbi:MAG: hypothetical protein FK734_16935 [Asgard group archaeon]|nr:hypothetical protein [Asgard group archaeon]